jgi:hypothetical protein
VGRHRKKAKSSLKKKQAQQQAAPADASGAQAAAPREAAAAGEPAPAPGKRDVVELPVASVADVAVEWWRLDRWSQGPDEGRLVARRVARRLSLFLEEQGVEVLDLTGKPYEAGLAVEVVESLADPAAPSGLETVDETVSPIVLWKGTVVRQGQVVKRRGTGSR